MFPDTVLIPAHSIHRHYWRLYIVMERGEDTIIARCDCSDELTKEQIEAMLNYRVAN